MRLLIAAVGKLKQGPERELCTHYFGRAEALGRSLGLSPLSSIELSESRAPDSAARRSAEAEALLAKIPDDFIVISLDPHGETRSSEAFASTLGAWRDDAVAPGAAFVIGGPDGHGQAVLDRAPLSLMLLALLVVLMTLSTSGVLPWPLVLVAFLPGNRYNR